MSLHLYYFQTTPTCTAISICRLLLLLLLLSSSWKPKMWINAVYLVYLSCLFYHASAFCKGSRMGEGASGLCSSSPDKVASPSRSQARELVVIWKPADIESSKLIFPTWSLAIFMSLSWWLTGAWTHDQNAVEPVQQCSQTSQSLSRIWTSLPDYTQLECVSSHHREAALSNQHWLKKNRAERRNHSHSKRRIHLWLHTPDWLHRDYSVYENDLVCDQPIITGESWELWYTAFKTLDV